MRLRRSLAPMAVVVGVALVAAAVALAGPAASTPASRCEERTPFPAGLADELAHRYPGRRFTAAVLDPASGCTYTLHPERRVTTASVVKLEILAGVLLRAQTAGRGLTASERARAEPMITSSADAPASQLWSSLGGVSGMEGVDVAFGLTETDHVGPVWGLTSTSALDQARLIEQVVTGAGGPLAAPYRAEARAMLTSVVASQRWGASAGVPTGWVVAQKNGFAGSACCDWRLNTVGWVERPDRSGWAVAVLSDGWASQDEGIAAVDELGARINAALADPPFGGPATAASGVDREDVFVRRPDGSVWQWRRATGLPARWVPAGGIATSDLDAADPGTGAPPEAWARGLDDAAWRWRWTGAGWALESIGGICTSGPAAAYAGPDRLDVACRGIDGQPWIRTWTRSAGWIDWQPLGGRIVEAPDIAAGDSAAGPAGTDPVVVGRGLDGALWVWAGGPGDRRVGSLGGICTSSPSIAVSAADRTDVFCRGQDGQLWSRWATPAAGWSSWHPLGGVLASAPDATARPGDGTPTVVVRGVDGATWRYRWSSSAWVLESLGQP